MAHPQTLMAMSTGCVNDYAPASRAGAEHVYRQHRDWFERTWADPADPPWAIRYFEPHLVAPECRDLGPRYGEILDGWTQANRRLDEIWEDQ